MKTADGSGLAWLRLDGAGKAHPSTWRFRLPRLPASVVTLVDQLLVSGCNFITTALIARALGLVAFGWYTMIWIAVLFAGSLQLGMIVSPMMSIGAKQAEQQADHYFGTIVVHQALFCVLAALVIGGAAGWLSPEGGGLVMLPFAAALAGGAYLAQDFVRRLIFARRRAHGALVADAVNQAVKMVLIAVIWWNGMLDVEGTLWIVAAAAATSALAAVPFIGPLGFSKAEFWPVTVRQWQSAKWLTGTALMQWATANSALMMTGGLLGPAAVGALRAAQTILGVLNISREAIENILPQQAGRALATTGLPGLRGILVRTGVLALAGCGVVVVALALFGDTILSLVYGPAFGAYGFIIAWLSLTFPTAMMILILICGFRALERTMPVFAATATAAIFNLATMYPAVRMFGVSGAIGVIIVSDCLIALILFYRMRIDAACCVGADGYWRP